MSMLTNKVEKLMAGRARVVVAEKDPAVRSLMRELSKAYARLELGRAGILVDLDGGCAVFRRDGAAFTVGETVYRASAVAYPVFCKCCGHQTRMLYSPRMEKFVVTKRCPTSLRQEQDIRATPDRDNYEIQREDGSYMMVQGSRRSDYHGTKVEATREARLEAKARTKASAERAKEEKLEGQARAETSARRAKEDRSAKR